MPNSLAQARSRLDLRLLNLFLPSHYARNEQSTQSIFHTLLAKLAHNLPFCSAMVHSIHTYTTCFQLIITHSVSKRIYKRLDTLVKKAAYEGRRRKKCDVE